MWRLLAEGASVMLVIWGLISIFNLLLPKPKEPTQSTPLDDLAKKAKEVKSQKDDILGQTEETKKVLKKIKDTLKD